MALTDGEKAIIAAINKLGNVIGGKEGAEGDVSTKKDEETGEQYIARLQKEVELMSQIGGHHEANLALLSKEKELNRKLLADAAEALKLALQKGEIGKDEANEKLKELGYKENFKYDEKGAKNLDWFYHLTGGHTHTDFFAIRSTDYSKANEGEDFENIW